MTPAEKRQMARAYARTVADCSALPVDEVEVADHFLNGMNMGIRVTVAEATEILKSRQPAKVLRIVRKD